LALQAEEAQGVEVQGARQRVRKREETNKEQTKSNKGGGKRRKG
jgi:hypothetical protein